MYQKNSKNKKNIVVSVDPCWHDFITYCEKIKFGEIQDLRIQSGLPITAKRVLQNINFSKQEGSKQ